MAWLDKTGKLRHWRCLFCRHCNTGRRFEYYYGNLWRCLTCYEERKG